MGYIVPEWGLPPASRPDANNSSPIMIAKAYESLRTWLIKALDEKQGEVQHTKKNNDDKLERLATFIQLSALAAKVSVLKSVFDDLNKDLLRTTTTTTTTTTTSTTTGPKSASAGDDDGTATTEEPDISQSVENQVLGALGFDFGNTGGNQNIMISHFPNRQMFAHTLAIIGIFSLNSLVSCLDIPIITEASAALLQVQKAVLKGTGFRLLSSPVGNTVEAMLQRRLTYFGRYYFLNASIGTPEQSLDLLIDTGSSDTWVYGNKETESSTSKAIPPPPFLNASYASGDKPNGTYVKDTFTLGPGIVKSLQFGVVEEGNLTTGGGIIGLSYDTAEFGPNKTFGYEYPDVLDALYNQSTIHSRSFGLYLNSGSIPEIEAIGSLVLGGYDKSKFTGSLTAFPIQSPSDVARVGLPLASISATVSGTYTHVWSAIADRNIKNISIPAVLDSGDMMTAIPILAYDPLIQHLNASYSGGLFEKPRNGARVIRNIDCRHSSADISVGFTFASPGQEITIEVPFSELVLQWHGSCLFALQPRAKPEKRPYWVNFGSSFIGSVYMVVDYDENLIQVANAKHGGGEREIVPINHVIGHGKAEC
ncbi:acid protease [Stipitochalara longipes BDJ]|nr:acid protease [Stipitochalara longipes BDJ]